MRAFIVTICLALLLAGQALPARAELEVGQRFGQLTFNGIVSPLDRAYLGLTRPGEFALKDVQARYVLLAFFTDT